MSQHLELDFEPLFMLSHFKTILLVSISVSLATVSVQVSLISDLSLT